MCHCHSCKVVMVLPRVFSDIFDLYILSSQQPYELDRAGIMFAFCGWGNQAPERWTESAKSYRLSSDGVIIQIRLSNSKTRALSDSPCFILIIKVILPFDYSLCNCNYFCREKKAPSFFFFLFEDFRVLFLFLLSSFLSPRGNRVERASYLKSNRPESEFHLWHKLSDLRQVT